MAYEETVKPDWTDADIPNFAGGINRFLNSTSIDNTQVIDGVNVRVDGDQLIGELGYFPQYVLRTSIFESALGGTKALSLYDPVRYYCAVGAAVHIYYADGSVFSSTIASFSSSQALTLVDALPNDLPVSAEVRIERVMLGTPVDTHQLLLSDETLESFIFTTLTLYKAETGQWVAVSNGVTNTLTGTPAQNATTLYVTSASGFTVGRVVRLVLDDTDGTVHHGVITAKGSGYITIGNHPLPYAAVALGTVTECVTFSGTVENRFSAKSIPWSDQMAFTNNLDPIGLYTDSTGIYTALSGLPESGNTKCKSLAVYDNSLFLLNTTEAGTRKPQRIRWCDIADLTNWTTGDSGFIDLYDNASPIMAGALLNSYLFIYKNRGIYRCAARLQVATGVVSTKRFDFDAFISDHGILSDHSLIALDDSSHLLLDKDNVWTYTGDFSITPIGHQIKSILFGPSGSLDLTKLTQISILHLEKTNEILIVYQATSDTVPKKALRYAVTEQKWVRREFAHAIYGTSMTDVVVLTWDDLDGDWNSQDYSWDSAQLAGGVAVPILIGGVSPNGQAFIYSQSYQSDNGIPIPFEVQTKDYADKTTVRHDWVELDINGTVSVSYSLNKGISFSLIETRTGTPGDNFQRFHKQFISDKYRYKFSGLAPGFRLGSATVRLQPESER